MQLFKSRAPKKPLVEMGQEMEPLSLAKQKSTEKAREHRGESMKDGLPEGGDFQERAGRQLDAAWPFTSEH